MARATMHAPSILHETAYDEHVVPVRLKRLHSGGELKSGTGCFWQPLTLQVYNAIRYVNETEAHRRFRGGGLTGVHHCRNHGFQKGERDGSACEALQKRTARDSFFCEEHSDLNLL